MADAAKKRLGGLKTSTYVGIAGAVVVVYLVYRWYANNQAANAASALTGGTATPGPNTTTIGATSTSGTSAPANIQQWIQAALTSTTLPKGYSQSAFYNDLTSWVNGNCVTSNGYNLIGGLISSLGLPPGYTPPSLTACAGTTTPTTTGASGPNTGSATGASTPTSNYLNPYYMNVLEHVAPFNTVGGINYRKVVNGRTLWSGLSQAVKLNIIVHNAAPGWSNQAWQALTTYQKLDAYATAFHFAAPTSAQYSQPGTQVSQTAS